MFKIKSEIFTRVHKSLTRCPATCPPSSLFSNLIGLWISLEHINLVPTSGPLLLLYPLPGMLFPPDICIASTLTAFHSLLKCHFLREDHLNYRKYPLSYQPFSLSHYSALFFFRVLIVS